MQTDANDIYSCFLHKRIAVCSETAFPHIAGCSAPVLSSSTPPVSPSLAARPPTSVGRLTAQMEKSGGSQAASCSSLLEGTLTSNTLFDASSLTSLCRG